MANMGALYQWMRKVLKNMSEDQLNELMIDMEDRDAIERISEAAIYHLENTRREVTEEVGSANELRDQDNLLRYRDIQSENRRPY